MSTEKDGGAESQNARASEVDPKTTQGNRNRPAKRPISRSEWQLPPAVAMWKMNHCYELCEVHFGLTVELRLRDVLPGPTFGRLYRLEEVQREEQWYVGRVGMVRWWLSQPERRQDAALTRRLERLMSGWRP